MFNFIGPFFLLCGVVSIAGIVLGLVKKNKKIVIASLILLIIISLLFLVIEGFLME
jgi:lipopolysaccharide export LptBFGC system permease protein LptF